MESALSHVFAGRKLLFVLVVVSRRLHHVRRR